MENTRAAAKNYVVFAAKVIGKARAWIKFRFLAIQHV